MAVTLTATELAVELAVSMDRAARLLSVVSALVERYAPDAPAAIQNEAAIRAGGWLAEQPAAGIRSESTGDISTSYAVNMPSALRASGGMALLSPWKTRRAGLV